VIRGFRRPDGRIGARNDVLVLPSVVCSTLAAQRVAGDQAVSIVHQHGCGHVGDDVGHTERAFLGIATNPNVGGVVVVGLGCETIQGQRLARRIQERGQRVEFVGIQTEGGIDRTVARGRRAVAALREELDVLRREAVRNEDLVVGIDDDGPLSEEVCEACVRRGTRIVRASGARGPERHVELAAGGAQVIVSLCGAGQAPVGFAVCPVLAVAEDREWFEVLRDDFDLDGPAVGSEAIVDRAVAAFNGEQVAAELRGARDFVLRRLARSM
jgi:altronate dehydratase